MYKRKYGKIYNFFCTNYEKKKRDDEKTITHKLRSIDSFRFMAVSLSDLADNMSEIFISKVCINCMERNKINAECKFSGLKGDELEYKCRECGEKWHYPINRLIRKFSSVYQFCKGDLNKFILLLKEGDYPYEDMDNWEKFDETTIPPKEAFYSKLNLKGISDADYEHTQKVWEVFEIKDCSKYHDLYAQSDTLLLADVFENFRKMCLEIYELDPVYFVSVPGLAWQACLKKIKVKLELLTDYDMSLMVEKGIRGGICQATHRYAKAQNKYLKNYDKNNESSYIVHLVANNLYGGAMSQK